MKIRGLTRNPSSTTSLRLKEKGVEMVAADMNDKRSLVTAFKVRSRGHVGNYTANSYKGATTIFAMTDFWGPFFARLAAGDTNDLWSAAIDEELAAGKRIVDAALQTSSTLERFIFSSLPEEMTTIPGKEIQGIPWAIGKVKTVEYIESCTPDENGKRISDVTQVILPAYYFENFASYHQYLYLAPKKVSVAALALFFGRMLLTNLLRTRMGPS